MGETKTIWFPDRILHRHVLFLVQIVLSFGVGAFCMVEAASGGDNEKVYIPVLTGIIGYWLPAPRPSNLSLIDTEDYYGKVAKEFDQKERELKKKLDDALAENKRLGVVYEKVQDDDRAWDAYDDAERGSVGRFKSL